MEEKIISYNNQKEIDNIVERNFKENYYFVGHNIEKHELHFKKFSNIKKKMF